MKKILFIILMLLCACSADAANYYVCPASESGEYQGNDSNSGLSGYPVATITRALAVSGSGDNVYFCSQGIWTNASTATVFTAESGVTYDGSTYGTGTRAKILTGHETSFGHVAAVSISVSDVTFKGFEVDGDSNSYNTYGIYIGEEVSSGTISNITIENCVVHHVGKDDWTYGILISSKGTSGTKISNVSITNTTVYNSYHEGIAIYPSWTTNNQQIDTVLVRGCTLYNNLQGIIIVNDSKNVTLEYNNIYNNTAEGLWIRISPDQPDNVHAGPTDVIVRYNIIQNNVIGIYITNGMGFLQTGSFYGNLIYNNQPVSSGSSGFNVSIHGNDTTPSFNSSVFNFYNNTIFSNRDAGSFRYSFVVGAYTNNITNLTVNLKNNIISDANNIPLYDRFGVFTHSNNLIYRSSGNTDTHVSITGTAYDRDGTASDLTNWEATAQKTDPTFTGGTLPTGFTGTYQTNMVPNQTYFAITTGDALANGATLGAPYNSSIEKAGLATVRYRPSGSYDIGAYQYGVNPYPSHKITGGATQNTASGATATWE